MKTHGGEVIRHLRLGWGGYGPGDIVTAHDEMCSDMEVPLSAPSSSPGHGSFKSDHSSGGCLSQTV